MPFNLAVTRTVNTRPRTMRLRGLPDSMRAEAESTIAKFKTGQLSMEAVITLSVGEPDDPSWERRTRWADVRDIWIEEA